VFRHQNLVKAQVSKVKEIKDDSVKKKNAEQKIALTLG
jgi:hypothetical protein